MADRFRIAIIGQTGKGDYGHGLDEMWRDVPGAEVVALCDEDEAGRAKAQERSGAKKSYADYREMLDKEKPDVVTIAARWLDRHHEYMLACAERGCHVFTEKPFCRNLTEADEIVAAFQRKHLKLAMALQTHYSPLIGVVKKMIAEQKLGTILELRGRGKEDNRGGGEDLWVLGTHIVDLMRLFAGDPTSCYATLMQNGKPVTKADIVEGNEGLGPLAGDAVDAQYAFPKDVKGYFASHRGQGGSPSRFGLQIYGSKGVLEILTGYVPTVKFLGDPGWSPARSKNKEWANVSSNGLDKPESLKPGPGSGQHLGNVAAGKDLLSAIREDREPLAGLEVARGAVEMVMAVFESHRVSGPVALPLTNRKHPLTML
jgi:predicted dehydrogenase